MPLWRIYHESSVFTDAQKASLARTITKLYTDAGLPPFYVNVIFIPVSASCIYTSGEPTTRFVRFLIEQIARTFRSEAEKKYWLDVIDGALVPHLRDRGDLTWEYHIVETERQLWRINSIVPPSQGTMAEKRWRRENRASAYAEEENVRSKMWEGKGFWDILSTFLDFPDCFPGDIFCFVMSFAATLESYIKRYV